MLIHSGSIKCGNVKTWCVKCTLVSASIPASSQLIVKKSLRPINSKSKWWFTIISSVRNYPNPRHQMASHPGENQLGSSMTLSEKFSCLIHVAQGLSLQGCIAYMTVHRLHFLLANCDGLSDGSNVASVSEKAAEQCQNLV